MTTAVSSASSSRSGPFEAAGYDVVVVKGYDKGFGMFSSTEFFIQFTNNTSIFKSMFKKETSTDGADNEELGRESTSNFARTSPTMSRPKSVNIRINDRLCGGVSALMVADRLVFMGEHGEYNTRPTSAILQQLGLRAGNNTACFECPEYQCEVSCSIW